MTEEGSKVLVVTSQLKKFIKSKSEMNTAGNVPGKLTEIIKQLVDQAIVNAKADGRKTVMDRDFMAPDSSSM